MSTSNGMKERALSFGRDVYYGHGKIEILPKVVVRSLEEMAAAYTPGVGFAVQEILARPEAHWEQTAKGNLIALISDGSAVLGLGKAGPMAAGPVMEGKAVMFKVLAGVDCVPLCLRVRSTEELIEAIVALEPNFGAINLEDIAAPACFEVVARLRERLSIPVLHDDQYGTATAVVAALINALEVTGKKLESQRVVINGSGAAGTAAADLLLTLGLGDLIMVDRQGILHRNTTYDVPHFNSLSQRTNRNNLSGDLTVALRDADVFIGLSVGGIVTGDMVRSMASSPIVFALANPEPEIMPSEAEAAGAAVVGTGRFDFPNQCNNVLAFPALIRGALDVRATEINNQMCLAAARAIAADVPRSELRHDRILPTPFSETLYPRVAEAVARAAVAMKVAAEDPGEGVVAENCRNLRALVAKRQNVVFVQS